VAYATLQQRRAQDAAWVPAGDDAKSTSSSSSSSSDDSKNKRPKKMSLKDKLLQRHKS
jgi:hypothetical protein